MCINDEEGSDDSLVPDGEDLIAVSKTQTNLASADIGGSVRSVVSITGQTKRVKPVEEISYG